MAQDNAENMSSSLLSILDNPSACAEVYLGFMAGFAFHAAKGQRGTGAKTADETLNRRIGAGKAMLSHQVLPDALAGQTLIQFLFDDRGQRLTMAGGTQTPIRQVKAKVPGVALAGFGSSLESEPGSHWLVLPDR